MNPYDYQTMAIKSALSLYLDTGVKVNSAYTLKNMIIFVTSKTGKTYKHNKKGGYEALADLTVITEEMKP